METCPKCRKSHYELRTVEEILFVIEYLDGEEISRKETRVDIQYEIFRCLECGKEFQQGDGDFEIGDEVEVEPFSKDNFHSFVGRISGFRDDLITVNDQDDDAWDVYPQQLTKM